MYYRVFGGQHHGQTFKSDYGCPPQVRFYKPIDAWRTPVNLTIDAMVNMDEVTDTYRRLEVAWGRHRRETILVPEQMPDEVALRLWERTL